MSFRVSDIVIARWRKFRRILRWLRLLRWEWAGMRGFLCGRRALPMWKRRWHSLATGSFRCLCWAAGAICWFRIAGGMGWFCRLEFRELRSVRINRRRFLMWAREWIGTSLSRTRVARNLGGIECLSGIPGSVGGTPVQNVGAYGQEVSETIVSVMAFDLNENRVRELTAEECGFSYRAASLIRASAGGMSFCGLLTGLSSEWQARAYVMPIYRSILRGEGRRRWLRCGTRYWRFARAREWC